MTFCNKSQLVKLDPDSQMVLIEAPVGFLFNDVPCWWSAWLFFMGTFAESVLYQLIGVSKHNWYFPSFNSDDWKFDFHIQIIHIVQSWQVANQVIHHLFFLSSRQARFDIKQQRYACHGKTFLRQSPWLKVTFQPISTYAVDFSSCDIPDDIVPWSINIGTSGPTTCNTGVTEGQTDACDNFRWEPAEERRKAKTICRSTV